MGRAVVGTNLLGAVTPVPPRSTVAGAVEAVAMVKAVVGAGLEVTELSREARVTDTYPVVAVLILRTPIRTPSQRTVDAHPTTITHTRVIHTRPMAVAVARALRVGAV